MLFGISYNIPDLMSSLKLAACCLKLFSYFFFHINRATILGRRTLVALQRIGRYPLGSLLTYRGMQLLRDLEALPFIHHKFLIPDPQAERFCVSYLIRCTSSAITELQSPADQGSGLEPFYSYLQTNSLILTSNTCIKADFRTGVPKTSPFRT